MRQKYSPLKDNYTATEVTITAVPHPIIGDMRPNFGPEARERLYVDRIEAMMLDNASL